MWRCICKMVCAEASYYSHALNYFLMSAIQCINIDLVCLRKEVRLRPTVVRCCTQALYTRTFTYRILFVHAALPEPGYDCTRVAGGNCVQQAASQWDGFDRPVSLSMRRRCLTESRAFTVSSSNFFANCHPAGRCGSTNGDAGSRADDASRSQWRHCDRWLKHSVPDHRTRHAAICSTGAKC